ncbi:HipA domain-containing protein [Treponema pectinovorum]|uniref:HipA domain-containing protein n=1 Tax=Treponema pectinovorum TaxID=164 RepID=UPI0011F253D5|nr:HipA domain-containing protein [Treponema pectinovorum]
MVYVLFHKDKKVLSAEFEAENNIFLSIIQIYNKSHIPAGLTTMPGKNLTKALNLWWQSRLIPKNRRDLNNNIDITEYFKNSNGFNLSDHYWIKSEKSDMTWAKGNYFNNKFNEDIGEYLINENLRGLKNMKSNSPDLFSNGEQDKRWVIIKNERLLLKYGKPPYYEQPFNEMLASEICRRLKISHAKYNFVVKKKDNPIIYSSCPCFIDGNTEFVPAGLVQYAEEKEKYVSEYQHLLNCCKKLGMKNISEIESKFAEMNVLDYITANIDRHYGNFGFIRDADTLEWKGVAPIFDTGNSMFYEYPTSDLRRSSSLMENVISKNFSQTQKKQIIKFANQEAYLNLDFSKLNGIGEYYKNIIGINPKVDKERAELLSKMLIQRIENVQNLILYNNDITKRFLIGISQNDSDIPFVKKIKNQIELSTAKENKIIESYLINLKASSSAEFEDKIKKDVKDILEKNKKKINKGEKSISQSDNPGYLDRP